MNKIPSRNLQVVGISPKLKNVIHFLQVSNFLTHLHLKLEFLL